MTWSTAAVLGLLGGAVVVAFSLAEKLGATRRWPWRSRRQIAPVVTGWVLRLFGSAVLPGVVAVDGRTASPLALFLLGAAAPLFMARAARAARVMLGDKPSPDPGDLPEGGADGV